MILFGVLPLGQTNRYFVFSTVLRLSPFALISVRQEWSLS